MFKDGESVQDNEMLSVLMIGQSNMAGRGDLGTVPEIDNHDCYMMRMGRWQPMRDPINVDRPLSDIPFPSGVSLAGSFADELSRYTGRRIGLIPCADGGTKIAQWQPGEVLFDHAVAMCNFAKRSSRLYGIIWHQGESDCWTDIDEYRRGLKNMFTQLRHTLGDPKLPIVAGELSMDMSDYWYECDMPRKINRTLHDFEAELPAFRVASSKDIPLRNDGVHFSAKGCRDYGIRYFEKFKELI